jgi:hypothetical protein
LIAELRAMNEGQGLRIKGEGLRVKEQGARYEAQGAWSKEQEE